MVSAWQIRNGYPKFSTGNLLTHSYGLVNYVLFYVFMFLPLVFELRTIIDWTWTETTMPIFDFIKMEVFYSKIYLVKCARVLEAVSIFVSFQSHCMLRISLLQEASHEVNLSSTCTAFRQSLR
jgi:hypothetical protein